MASNKPAELPGQMPSSFDNEEVYNEKPIRKIVRRLKEEPLVPLGIGLTVFAFTNAYRALRRGDSQQANRMFRARIAAQGFTVVAMVAGSMYYQKDREKNKELRKLQEQREAEERRQKWIRELEIRDEEDKVLKERLQKKVQAAAAAAAVAAAEAEAEVEAESDAANGQEEEVEVVVAVKEPEGERQKNAEGGGILSNMGLWNRGQKAALEQQDLKDEVPEKKTRKENPRSSLGAIGESIKKKDE
ncbi:Respiratory supercomplex factor 1 [Escovopsis weberi]|uniref:Respiratory supercomplex factor 1 n=1 Tax=Escovopsis weberi TaxID=150374 RepID=A0A0M8N7D4_ESCWE|nr:Respiratory supercomplex factor 1 [Escovopsis weberi]